MNSSIMAVKGRATRSIHPSSRPLLVPSIACAYQLVPALVVVAVHWISVIADLKFA